MIRSGLAAALLLCIVAGAAPAAWDDYRPATLHELVQRYERDTATALGPDGVTVFAGKQAFRVIGAWTGGERVMAEWPRRTLEAWNQANRTNYAGLFRHEVEIEDGGHRLWMPIQETMLADFVRDAKRGKRLTLFIMALGRSRDGWLFIVNEFRPGP